MIKSYSEFLDEIYHRSPKHAGRGIAQRTKSRGPGLAAKEEDEDPEYHKEQIENLKSSIENCPDWMKPALPLYKKRLAHHENRLAQLTKEKKTNEETLEESVEPLYEHQADEILSHLSAAHNKIMKSDAYTADGKKDVNRIHDSIRRSLLNLDIEEFKKRWEHYASNNPDAFDEYAGEAFEHAGLGPNGTFREFMNKTKS